MKAKHLKTSQGELLADLKYDKSYLSDKAIKKLVINSSNEAKLILKTLIDSQYQALSKNELIQETKLSTHYISYYIPELEGKLFITSTNKWRSNYYFLTGVGLRCKELISKK